MCYNAIARICPFTPFRSFIPWIGSTDATCNLYLTTFQPSYVLAPIRFVSFQVISPVTRDELSCVQYRIHHQLSPAVLSSITYLITKYPFSWLTKYVKCFSGGY